ncbi:HAD family phosphatase [Xenorhabdus sp. PB30.3]|uniref:HAD family hydrolase n=1 Tax=Xenorhabdus sp. PB30.3 TaxID=2788941 RepID=UPI001E2BEC78|nr:HAD-IA family hydrolase [Xenorhabdus sp. PB30.3]MCC8381653.1 HAD-IA family hydrolase [Xenorhabdus sp. PB30.3]
MKLIIFDCDGTLVDSEHLCNLALHEELRLLGLESDPTSLLKSYRGMKLAKIIESLEQHYCTIFPEDFESKYRCRMNSMLATNLKPNEGVEELLESLDISFCVASSAPMEKILLSLKVTGLLNYFKENIFSSYDINSWKPEPDIFLHAAQSMSTNPEDCLVVEDSYVGIEAAFNANMKSAYYNINSAMESKFNAIQIRSMSEVLDIIQARKKPAAR